MIPGERQKITRPSGTYIISDGMEVGDRPMRVTFPTTYEIEAMRGVSVDAVVFATRAASDYPFWCDFKHPDGHWRSTFARREWVTPLDADGHPPDVHDPGTHAMPQQRPATRRAAFKRPTTGGA